VRGQTGLASRRRTGPTGGEDMEQPDERLETRALLPAVVGESRSPDLDHALLGLAEQLLRAAEPHEVATSLLESVVATYGFPRALVLGRSEGRLSALAAHGVLAPAVGTGSSAAVSRAQEQRVAQVVAQLDPEHEPWLARLLPAGASLVVVPVVAAERALGALVLQVPVSLRGPQGRRLLREVERSVSYAGLALHRVQRLAQLQRLASTDDLTSTGIRRGTRRCGTWRPHSRSRAATWTRLHATAVRSSWSSSPTAAPTSASLWRSGSGQPSARHRRCGR
jgi:hypothetical protein